MPSLHLEVEGQTPLPSEIGDLEGKACINEIVISFINYPKPRLLLDFLLTELSTQSISFFVLSIHHKFILSLSKKYKSCLLWSLLKSHVYETSMLKN